MPLSSAGSVLAFAASLSLLLFAVGMLFQRLRQRERLRDAERLRRSEAMLQEQRRLLDLFIQNAPASIAMLDKEMRYIHASRRWLRDYRLYRARLFRPDFSIKRPSWQPAMLHALRSAFYRRVFPGASGCCIAP